MGEGYRSRDTCLDRTVAIKILPTYLSEKPESNKRFEATDFNNSLGQFSRDGRWVAYVSSQSGRNEIYAVAFPNPAARLQISSGGGDNPQWRGDGKELFYTDPDSRIVPWTSPCVAIRWKSERLMPCGSHA
ncbi:MAG: hypothetical protein LAN83_13475 [Acidobacteriia bacterium]|nr:hypothetical protein [Terriglobia bacterium]